MVFEAEKYIQEYEDLATPDIRVTEGRRHTRQSTSSFKFFFSFSVGNLIDWISKG